MLVRARHVTHLSVFADSLDIISETKNQHSTVLHMEVYEVGNECIAKDWNAEISVITLQAPTEVQPGNLLLALL